MNIYATLATLFRFRLHRTYKSLSFKDRSTTEYVTRNVHGVLFRDYRRDLPQIKLKTLIIKLINDCNEKHYYIGYKDGNLERDILTQAGAPIYC